LAREQFTLTLLQIALWALLTFPAANSATGIPAPSAGSPSDQQKHATRSPHGPLSLRCENCHTAAAWRPIRAVPEFDHNKSSYPLRGMHETVKCTQCHTKPVFSNASKNCADCHADIHRRQMGPDCAQCHTVNGWNIAVQQVKDHQNRFPLLGAHAAIQCDQCHTQLATGIFYGLSTQCNSCHLKDWQNTTNPPHPNAGPAFASSNCQGCHNFDSWLDAKFDHTTTGFPLTAGHANVPCLSCHINNNYNLQIAPTDCGNAGCHLTTWQQTNAPPHPQAGPTFAIANCSQCHNTTSWTTATFNHVVTGFPLTGAHATTPCVLCHVNNNYNLTAANTDCYGCHTSDWASTQTLGGLVPNHVAAQFPTSLCSTCHDTIAWADGQFNHSTTGWPLTGAHQMPPAPGSAITACTNCHVNNNYSLTAANTACYGCHQSDWNSTQTLGGLIPNHIAAGFPTTCDTCHTTTTWLNATFDHTYFPIPHHSSVCNDCHQVSTDYSSFTCINCHTSSAHQQVPTTNQHNGVANFVYGPTTCYNCHKNGGDG
jgi:nitrate/TMAO reductase-like tetraheme cytochrome c subunit